MADPVRRAFFNQMLLRTVSFSLLRMGRLDANYYNMNRIPRHLIRRHDFNREPDQYIIDIYRDLRDSYRYAIGEYEFRSNPEN